MPALNTSVASPSSSDLETLRSVLFGKDYNELIALKDKLQDHNKYSQSIANVISEALAIRSSQDDSVAKALAPTIQSALNQSIADNPKPMADALYPIMGPAIRKSISEALSQMMETLNQLLEQRLTIKSLVWRFEAWKTGRSFSEVVLLKTLEFQVEQVFLINREDGLLLQHVAIESVVTQDGDMLSGMLTAIQDFINDSFVDYNAENTGINTLKLGDLTVFIEHSPNAIIAMVIRGKPPESIRRLQVATLEYIQKKYANALHDFNGDSRPFDSTKPLLKRCLKSQKQKRKSSRFPLLIISMLLISVLAYWAYSLYQADVATKKAETVEKTYIEQQNRRWNNIVDSLNSEPGLVVVNDNQVDKQIHLLMDPLARLPKNVLGEAEASNTVTFNTKPYLSIDDEILLSRSKQFLTPPSTVTLSVNNLQLKVVGRAPLDWSETLQQKWRQVAGVNRLDTTDLVVFDPNLPRLKSLKKELESISIAFDRNRSQLSNAAIMQIKRVSRTINKMVDLTKESNKILKIFVMGFSDSTGTELINNKLSQQRADVVKYQLISEGVSESVFSKVSGAVTNKNERSVHFQVKIQ